MNQTAACARKKKCLVLRGSVLCCRLCLRRMQSEFYTVLRKMVLSGIEDRKNLKLRISPRSITLLPSNRCFVRQAWVMTSEIKDTKPLHCHKL